MDTTDPTATPPVVPARYDDDTTDAGPCVLLTVEAAAARLSISRTRMYGLLKTGDVDSIRIGRLRRIPATELDTLVERLRRTA